MSPKSADPRDEPSRESGSSALRWVLRLVVVGGLAATLVMAGPRAWQVLASRLRFGSAEAAGAGGDEPLGPLVATDRLSAIAVPEWLRGELFRAVLSDFEPRLRGSIAIMDEAAATKVLERLRASPFVLQASLERRFPDRFGLRVALRRPVARWFASERGTVLFDAEGVALPSGGTRCEELPQIALDGAAPLDVDGLEAGVACVDLRVVAACAVAAEWRDAVAALGGAAPRLLAIDPRNLGYAFVADPRHAQVLVGLETADARVAWFGHGLAQRHGGAVSAATRAEVLGKILALRPGLVGVEAADLRLANTWRNSLVPGEGRPAPGPSPR